MKISRLSNLTSLRQQAGFTLIEMMVVLVLIGIIVGSVVLSINTDKLEEHMEIEMNRLRALIMLAREEAILQDHDMALTIKEGSYSFQRYDIKEEQWFAMDDGQVFRERRLPPGTEMVLVIEDLASDDKKNQPGLSRNKDEDEQDDKKKDEDANIQRVVIFPSGEIFPFELILRKEDQSMQFKLVANQDGEVIVEIPDGIS